jgi:hypothetical protein
MTKIENIKKKLILIDSAMRNITLWAGEIKEDIESISPANNKPKIRRNLKEERFSKYYQKVSQ